jgi:Bacterial extracellular solute-binding proteins, family 5 Middle
VAFLQSLVKYQANGKSLMQIYAHRTERSYKNTFGLRTLGLALGLLVWIAPVYAQEVLRVPYVADIGTFDPDNGFETGAMSAIDNVYEGLVEYEPGSTKIVGLLAKSWEISDDGLTYTFHLVDGVKFHDGTPFNAAAVIQSFERRRDRGLILSYFLANVKDMRAPDDSTVVLTLDHPQPSLLDALSSPWGPKIISPVALAEHDNGDFATTWLNEHAVGTGPFKLAEFKRGQRSVSRQPARAIRGAGSELAGVGLKRRGGVQPKMDVLKRIDRLRASCPETSPLATPHIYGSKQNLLPARLKAALARARTSLRP